MKRRTVKTLFCAALMALTLSMTACGGSDDAAASADAATEEAAPEEAPAAEEEAPAEEAAPEGEEAPAEEAAPEEEAAAEQADGEQKTLEDFLMEDPTAEKQLEEQAVAQGNDQMDMAIEIKGNDVMCIATFKEGVELPDDVADTLNAGMDQVGSMLSGLAGTLDNMIGAEKGTVSYGIRYCDSDGNVLAEASFRAE